MPHILRFHDTDDGTTFPDPATVGHAAAWAAERGYWDVATSLMELAHALANLERPVPPAEHPESALTLALERRDGAAHCEHGYLAKDNIHTTTGGVCDLSAGNGV